MPIHRELDEQKLLLVPPILCRPMDRFEEMNVDEIIAGIV